MAAHQPGLNKKISSIFDGVPVPKDKAGDDKSDTKLPDFITDQVETAPLPPQQKPQPPHQQYFPSPEPQKTIQKPVEKTTPPAPGKVKTITEPKRSFSEGLKNIKAKLLGSKHGTGSLRQKAMIVAIPILVIVLIFVYVKVLMPAKPKRRATPQTPQTQGQSTQTGTINWEIPKPLTGSFRDPMRFDSSGSYQSGDSPDGVPVVGSGILIKGIVHSNEKPTAVIGGYIVHEGDVINDVLILKINQDSIELEKDGQKRTLEVGDTWPSFDETEQPNSDQ